MLTGVVLTKNEEENILSCLKMLSFCEELLVVDDYSTDRTTALVKKFGARVLKRKMAGDFAAQRNFALNKVKPGWVLFIDADERVSPQLREQIKRAIGQFGVNGFYLRQWLQLFEILNNRRLHT